jgi:hypothetical protein
LGKAIDGIWLSTILGRASVDYSTTDQQPPVLHRKETFVTPTIPTTIAFAGSPSRKKPWAFWTSPEALVPAGLGKASARSRPRNSRSRPGLCHSNRGKIHSSEAQDQRHRAAIARVTASKPVRLAVEAGLFPPDTTYFDYGCGHGADIEYIQRLGLTSSGWDPHYRLMCPSPADVVNLGYVINVIEDTAERREALINAWNLAQKVLIVAAQVLIDDRTRGVIAYGDGIITRRNTFQKYYEQEELKVLHRPGARG